MKKYANDLSPLDWAVLAIPYIHYDTVAVNEMGAFGFNSDFITVFLSTLPYLPFKLKLRPLISMTPDEALDLIKTAAPDAFGDYRYLKWEVKPDEKNDRNWTAYIVKRPDKGDGRIFVIDLINGRVVLYDDKIQDDGALAPYYFGWYYEHGFDVPTYPTGKTLKELNLAYYE